MEIVIKHSGKEWREAFALKRKMEILLGVHTPIRMEEDEVQNDLLGRSD